MIVIQHGSFHDLVTREEKRVQVRELGLPPEAASLSPLGSVGLTGMSLNRHTIIWTIDEESVRGFGFRMGKLAIPSAHIERFLVTSDAIDSFSLWVRGTFRFPTRLPLALGDGESEKARLKHSDRREATFPAQNMEIGCFFGTVPQRRLAAGLRHLEYTVEECSWDEFLAWDQPPS